MPVSGKKIVDANVWLAAVFSDYAHHLFAVNWFANRADRSCVFCRVTQKALLRHLTNGKIMGKFVQSQITAWLTHDKLANDPRCLFWGEPSTLAACFRSLTQAATPSHERWTDAYLASFAISSQSALATFDRGFKKFSGLDLDLIDHALS